MLLSGCHKMLLLNIGLVATFYDSMRIVKKVFFVYMLYKMVEQTS